MPRGGGQHRRNVQLLAVTARTPQASEVDQSAGAALLPRPMAVFGSRRERWQSAAELQCDAVIAPITESSGRQRVMHRRWACPQFVRQTFHEWATLTVRCCAWARACYGDLRGRGKGHNAAVRALAYKWIRILFRCWQERVPYDEQRYQQSQQCRAEAVSAAPTRR
ncbi:MAG: transposase [Acidobacteriaceae bacterium]|nr:transposase [Acidobacteriaceae bacterium]